MTTVTRYEALRKVRACFETEQAMADAFEVSQPTIWRWLNQSKQLPAQHVLRASNLTGISPHVFRPDIYPVELPPSGSFIGVASRDEVVAFNGGHISHAQNFS